jgi:hypothetical protein
MRLANSSFILALIGNQTPAVDILAEAEAAESETPLAFASRHAGELHGDVDHATDNTELNAVPGLNAGTPIDRSRRRRCREQRFMSGG